MGRTSNARESLMKAALELIWGDSYSTVTVEAICARAKVKKGTFYHFFGSKSNLVEAVIAEWWGERRKLFETIFRPEIKPLERIWTYLESIAQNQLRVYESSGQIIGAPLFILASEVCTKDEKLRLAIDAIIKSGIRYFEDAIREAQLSGEAGGEDAARTARLLWGFYAATLMRARIEKDPKLIRTLVSDARELIHASSPALHPVSAERGKIDFGAALDQQTYRRTMEREVNWRAAFTESASTRADPEEMLVLTDGEGRVEWVNEAFSRMCGYTLEELRGQRPGRLLQGAKSDPAAVALLRDAVNSFQACDCRIVNYRKDGTPYQVLISLRPVFVGGRLDGFFAVEREIKGKSN